MNTIIQNRIQGLRELMAANGIHAYLINGSDPHMSEYVPERWQSRAYISGFSGSFGWLAITSNRAVLWTDSRYYLQAERQLEGTGIEMFKVREAGTPSLEDWLASELLPGQTVGFDGACYATAEVRKYEKVFSAKEIGINAGLDLLEQLWSERPALPLARAFLHPLKWAGKSRKEKFEAIRASLVEKQCDLTIIAALDDLGWTFNLRGADVDCNPVVLGYGIVSLQKVQLFINLAKLNKEEQAELISDGVELFPYEDFIPALQALKEKRIYFDQARTNYLIHQTLKGSNTFVSALSVPALLKSMKNEQELEGMKKAHVADGLALLDFQLWLDDVLGKERITEYDVAQKLIEFRSKRMGYVGASFFPIVGYIDHGAIVHFRVSPETAHELKPEGILLFDSGGQYEFGTTDITRTIALGPVSDQMKRDFTLVLKGMIQLSSIRFPKGTLGCHLDVLARAALWKNALNYGHGTGHGVGAFMNVHEGPGSIRPDLNDQPIRPGNVFSNEPGLYRAGAYGIRIENLLYCVEDTSNEFGEFYQFKTLTKFPIDTRLIDPDLLSPEEREWVNAYHQSLLSGLSYFTNSDQFALLKRLTQAI